MSRKLKNKNVSIPKFKKAIRKFKSSNKDIDSVLCLFNTSITNELSYGNFLYLFLQITIRGKETVYIDFFDDNDCAENLDMIYEMEESLADYFNIKRKKFSKLNSYLMDNYADDDMTALYSTNYIYSIKL